MDLIIPEAVVAAMHARKSTMTPALKEKQWGGLMIDHSDVHPDDLAPLRDAAARVTSTVDTRRLLRKLKQAEGIQAGARLTNLELLADELRRYISELPNRRFYTHDEGDNPRPYLLSSVTYYPARNNGDYWEPAHVNVQATAFCRGHDVSFNEIFYRQSLGEKGATAEEALEIIGGTPETPELNKAHEEACLKYEELRNQTGLLLIAAGPATKAAAEDRSDDDDYGYRWWRSRESIPLDHEGVPTRAVVDDKSSWGTDKRAVTLNKKARKILGRKYGRSVITQDEDDEETNIVTEMRPLHPYIRIFDLRKHQFFTTHINNVRPYIYNRRAFEKVIIPADDKTLIDALVASQLGGDDIIAGKGKGVIVLSSGPPGTGKTLSAEAYSERSQRPLYSVQCSQLGLSPEELEKTLARVMDRAVRWNANLLLDEADVYIRERGDDLIQNAVVGVFLRLLEYYGGVLFMTTNRSTMVDDAILSRCVVHIRYKLPDTAAAQSIWRIMWQQFVALDNKAEPPAWLAKAAMEFPHASGRTIKQLMRLGAAMAERLKKPCDLEMLKWVARYQDSEVKK